MPLESKIQMLWLLVPCPTAATSCLLSLSSSGIVKGSLQHLLLLWHNKKSRSWRVLEWASQKQDFRILCDSAARKGYKLIGCPALAVFRCQDRPLYIFICSQWDSHVSYSIHPMTRRQRRLSPHHSQSDSGKQKSAAVELIAMWCRPFIDFVTLQRLQQICKHLFSKTFGQNTQTTWKWESIYLWVEPAQADFFELSRSYFSVSQKRKKHHKMKVNIGQRTRKNVIL